MPLNYYEVLGCSEESTQEEVKRAYHRRLLQFHPDKNSAADVQEFHDVREAWQILRHRQSRRKYDATCKQEQLEEEEEDGPVYARLSLDDMEESVFEDMWFYRCRCGDKYFVDRDTLPEKDSLLQVKCNGCTLIIIVEI
ncbi:dnaJ homolog subfamily B member 14 [Temnothorax longispinosus]|uniref:DnaJ-like protein subfamily C member 24 n=1 Tax=Temnothorax longispinosus TaxID=300112 RepID=A0A4V3SBV1_9HYME|nr:DnaJ-like protein subfamily C member 24 [Temnothorax longispinosus]